MSNSKTEVVIFTFFFVWLSKLYISHVASCDFFERKQWYLLHQRLNVSRTWRSFNEKRVKCCNGVSIDVCRCKLWRLYFETFKTVSSVNFLFLGLFCRQNMRVLMSESISFAQELNFVIYCMRNPNFSGLFIFYCLQIFQYQCLK